MMVMMNFDDGDCSDDNNCNNNCNSVDDSDAEDDDDDDDNKTNVGKVFGFTFPVCFVFLCPVIYLVLLLYLMRVPTHLLLLLLLFFGFVSACKSLSSFTCPIFHPPLCPSDYMDLDTEMSKIVSSSDRRQCEQCALDFFTCWSAVLNCFYITYRAWHLLMI